MTRPTEAEIRAEPAGRRLDAWVEWWVLQNTVKYDQHLGYGRYLHNIGWDHVPRYSTDPAACADLKQHLWASGKFSRIECETCIGTSVGPFACVVLVPRDGDMDKLISCNENIDTDPIAAECVAWCRAALIAALNR